MNRVSTTQRFFILAILLAPPAFAGSPLGAAFTYQGRLDESGQPYNGSANVVFKLYDADAGGTLRGTQTFNGLSISNGLFTVKLNGSNEFGSNPFNGDATYLEIAVNGTTLAPRQPLTATPYALALRLPLTESVASSADSINLTQTGTGDCAQFNIVNSANVGEAVEARTDGSGDAVQAVTTGTGRAGYFQISNSSSASSTLYVTSNATGHGIYCIKTAGSGDAIYGESATGHFGRVGTGAVGVHGQHGASNNFGYLGSASYGLYAQHDASGNYGYVGSATYGVRGFSTDNPAVFGSSVNSDGVSGFASTSARAGVYGETDTTGGYGVFGRNTSGSSDSTGSLGGTYGVRGVSPSGGGYFDTPNGFTGSGCFVGSSNVSDALFAAVSGDGLAGRFQSDGADSSDGVLIIHDGRGRALDINNDNSSGSSSRLADLTGTGGNAHGVFISVPSGHTGLSVTSGTKNAVVRTSAGPRFMYCEEASEVWFADYGSGELVDGRAHVTIDPLMAETVNLDEKYHVFVQPDFAECSGLAVVNRTATGFDVIELGGGESAGEFSYRLVAKRREYEHLRLEHCPQAENDPNLYPERHAAWQAEHRGRKPIPPSDGPGPREAHQPDADDGHAPRGASSGQ